jgi:hypothetical protein
LDFFSLVGVVVLVKNFASSYLFGIILAVETVEFLCPEVNMRSSHNTKTISISIWRIARGIGARAGELKAGPKTQKLLVQGRQCPKTLNRIYARSSHT